ncbi:MAG: UDP-N-acetylmuramoyl-L-alanine--D-glutamate ligase [Candidatus Marinimicrobia bacterium]|nr:UDP-N-acetylmuramoyl-L-alanine--D-glutamate ligase [Candidatus Neomarinimicrobiota bacterium]
MTHLKKIENKNISVIGAGLSGLYVAALATQKGAQVFLSEYRTKKFSKDELNLLERYNIDYETGGHTEQLENADLYIISPGIPKETDIYQSIKKSGQPVISEIEFASWFADDTQIIAITGTNGKSTTVRLVDHLFKGTHYNAYLGGNIGIPFSKLILEMENITQNKVFILEISSFQLEDIIDFKPYISMILNITADHLDRYQGDIDKYLEAKLQIAANQTKDDFYYYDSEDSLLTKNIPDNTNSSAYDQNNRYKDIIELKEDGSIFLQNGSKLKIRGRHNYKNILAAVAVCQHFQISKDHIMEQLNTFSGLAHRLEFVKNIKGIEFYNDSKSTNIDSVIQALTSFKQPMYLIMGGRDKDLDFSELLPYLNSNIKEIILIGEAADKIQKQLQTKRPIMKKKDLEQAVQHAYHKSSSGSVVLLSPGCASFDMYENYKKRGQHFKALVNSLQEQR